MAFSAGVITFFNPCGFALLPAYYSYLLEGKGPVVRSGGEAILRILKIGALASAGFLTVLLGVGAIVSEGGIWLAELLPRLQVVLGSGLIILGILWLSGSSFLSFSGPIKIKNSQKSFYLFGLLYGLGGISCMFPVFLSIAFEATALGGFLSGIIVFLVYGLGLGAMMVSITAIIVLSKEFILNRLIKATHYIKRIAGILLIGAGVYLIYYWFSSPVL